MSLRDFGIPARRNDTLIVLSSLRICDRLYLSICRQDWTKEKIPVRSDDSSDFSYLMVKRREPSSMIAPFIMEIRSKGSLIEFRATGHFVSSLTFSLTDSLLGGRPKGKKKEATRKAPVIRARKSFLDLNDSYRSQKQD